MGVVFTCIGSTSHVWGQAIHKEKGKPICLQSATVICHASSEHAYKCTHCKVLHDTTSIFEAIYHRIIIYHTDNRWCSLAAPQKTSYKQSTSVSEYRPKFSNNVSTTNKTSYLPSGTNKKLSCPASACRRSETSQANPQIIWTCPRSTERPSIKPMETPPENAPSTTSCRHSNADDFTNPHGFVWK